MHTSIVVTKDALPGLGVLQNHSIVKWDLSKFDVAFNQVIENYRPKHGAGV